MKLIKLQDKQDKFILVRDEELIKGDKAFDTTTDNGIYSSVLRTAKDSYWNKFKLPKIIAGIPELPSIDFSELKEEDCKEIGYVDVEKLAEFNCGHILNDSERIIGFIEGFKQAQSLNDKMFSLVDIENAYNSGKGYGVPDVIKDFRSFIQSLQQNVWNVEVEVEDNLIIKGESDSFNYDNGEKINTKYGKPKITNGKIKVTKILLPTY